MVIDVTLTPEEDSKAAAAALAVNENKERLGKPTRQWGAKAPDAFDIRYQSFRAELAVAKVLGLAHTGWEILAGGDGKIDLTVPFPTRLGTTIQVKYRGERNRDLATEGIYFWRELKCAIYVVAWPGPTGSVTLAGWCTRGDFLDRIVSRPPVRMLGEKWEMRWQDLRPMSQLVEEVAHARAEAAAGGHTRQDAERQGQPGGSLIQSLAGAGS